MYSIPARILNDIYKTQKKRLVTPFAKRVFKLPEMEIDQQVGEREKELKKEGVSLPVRLAYMTVMPLLWEREAIAAYLREKELGTSPVLPNITTVEEAVYLGNLDFPMDENEQNKLRELLRLTPK